VQIFHGMAGEKKGHFRIRHYFDLYLTQGPYFTNRFNQLASKHKDFKVIETGWSKLDTLFKGNSDYQKEKKELLNKKSKSHLVLYAPTFSPSLTSAIDLRNEIFEQAKNQDIYLMIKFHDLMNKDVMLEYEQMAKSYDNVEVVTERNILKYLVMADIMISDTSSVVYEFVFLNKPVITLNSKSPSIVWLNISQPAELSNALTDTINNDPFAAKRQDLITQYHPYTDGLSSKRMIAAVEGYIADYGVPQRRKLNLLRRHKMNKDFGTEPK
jgi:CDP-glycerol glycerophosphotransferase (TagB/SpsB family)